jgi:hypothetical protein
MPIVTELVVSVVGGVLTALVLALFSRGSSSASAPAPATQVANQVPVERRRSGTGDFFRMVFSVIGGIAVAMVLGRVLAKAGVLPQGVPARMILLVVGTIVFWLLLTGMRRR